MVFAKFWKIARLGIASTSQGHTQDKLRITAAQQQTKKKKAHFEEEACMVRVFSPLNVSTKP